MPQRAHVTSVEALETFKASLINYLAKAIPTLEEARGEVLRTRVWIESDRRPHWENQLRRRTLALEQAQQALFSARLSSLGDATADGRAAVHKARRAVEEARIKLGRLRTWNREFDTRMQPLLKQLESLSTFLAHDMPQGVGWLAQAADTLSAYAGVTARSSGAGEGPPRGGTAGSSSVEKEREDVRGADLPPGENV